MNLQDTIEAVQRKVGIEADGDPREDTWNAIAKNLGVVSHTYDYVQTIERCQRAVNVEDDGDPGPQTWGAVARALGVLTIVAAPGRGILGELAEIAESQIGTQEDAKHTNRGAAILKYQQSTNLGGQGWPWCAAFVDWCMQEFLTRHISYAEHGFKRSQTASAYGLIDWAREQKLLVFAPSEIRQFGPNPQRGDIVVYNFSHTGIVAFVDPLRVVEGNTNDVGGRDGYIVARRSRACESVKKFIRLPELKAV